MQWMPQPVAPRAKMTRIIFHWTAGGAEASALDRKHYHLLIEADGNLVRGDLPIDANAGPIRGNYAAHTRNANTGAIGVALCGMHKAQERPFDPGPKPITKDQWDALVDLLATLCRRYGIAPKADAVLSHAEVEPVLGIKQRGKWDIARLPWDESYASGASIGARLRGEVRSALAGDRAVSSGGAIEMTPAARGADRSERKALQGRVTASSLNFRSAPDGEIVGSLPRGVQVTILDHDDGWYEVRTPGGYVGFVSGKYVTILPAEPVEAPRGETRHTPDTPVQPEETTPMQTTKSWMRSKGVLGAAGALIIPVLGEFIGISIGEGDAQEIVEVVTMIGTTIAAVVALIGRITARERIG